LLRFDAGSNKARQWGVSFMGASSPVVECNHPEGSSEFVCEFQDNLQPGTTYTWSVNVVYDPEVCPPGGTCSNSSPEWTFTTPASVPLPAAPQIVLPADGATLAADEVGFKWNPVEGATQYQIGWREEGYPSSDWQSYSFIDEAPSGYLDTGVFEKGKKFIWGVRARNYYGWSDWSVASFTVLP
jgi:hypothetical protein